MTDNKANDSQEIPPPSDKYASRLNRRLASRYLLETHGIKRAPQTLAKDACRGGGPTFHYDGRFPIYERKALDAYALARITGPFKSTSEHAARTKASTAPTPHALTVDDAIFNGMTKPFGTTGGNNG